MAFNVEFTVYGTPRPQGSMRAFIPRGAKFPVVTADNKKLKPWRNEVAGVAVSLDVQCIAAHIPVSVDIAFFFARPKSVKRTAMTVKPDIDKLIRSVLDAITGILINDDSQVCSVLATKAYSSTERAVIRLTEQQS